jgi:hypothetical protein
LARKEGVSIVREFVESMSAKSPGRPVFDNMIKEIERGHAEGIISWHPDRLARNAVDGGRIVHLLSLGQLKGLKFPKFWFENTPQGKFMLNIAFGLKLSKLLNHTPEGLGFRRGDGLQKQVLAVADNDHFRASGEPEKIAVLAGNGELSFGSQSANINMHSYLIAKGYLTR